MEYIQVALHKKLLEVTERVARSTKQNLSALIRDALRAREARDRQGYSKQAQADDRWEAQAGWPENSQGLGSAFLTRLRRGIGVDS
jgi:hypothetical protein